MKNERIIFWRTYASAVFIVGCMLTGTALLMLVLQMRNVTALREQLTMTAENLPTLRTRIRILESDIEAERLYGSEARASQEEQASVFILPETIDVPRSMRMITAVVNAVADDKHPLSIASFTFDPDTRDGTRIATLRMKGNYEAFARVFSVLQWSGMLTVSDVLAERASAFLSHIESIAPLSLPSAEAFLRTDLLVYAADPDGVEQRFLQDLPESVASDVRIFVLESGLNDVRMSLTPAAAALKEQRVWPFPLIGLRSFVYEDQEGTIELAFFIRPSESSDQNGADGA